MQYLVIAISIVRVLGWERWLSTRLIVISLKLRNHISGAANLIIPRTSPGDCPWPAAPVACISNRAEALLKQPRLTRRVRPPPLCSRCLCGESGCSPLTRRAQRTHHPLIQSGVKPPHSKEFSPFTSWRLGVRPAVSPPPFLTFLISRFILRLLLIREIHEIRSPAVTAVFSVTLCGPLWLIFPSILRLGRLGVRTAAPVSCPLASGLWS